ncbi:MAG: hypothetical protein ACI9UK_002117, partial [Candidatus Krumholzibacteriia bacterium]|jgi:hypothetical protein
MKTVKGSGTIPYSFMQCSVNGPEPRDGSAKTTPILKKYLGVYAAPSFIVTEKAELSYILYTANQKGPQMATKLAKQAIDELTTRFFAAFATQDGAPVDLGPLRKRFLPTAVITRTCHKDFEAYDLDSFLAPREALLNSGELVDFSEYEAQEETQIYGDIAQRWSI